MILIKILFSVHFSSGSRGWGGTLVDLWFCYAPTAKPNINRDMTKRCLKRTYSNLHPPPWLTKSTSLKSHKVKSWTRHWIVWGWYWTLQLALFTMSWCPPRFFLAVRSRRTGANCGNSWRNSNAVIYSRQCYGSADQTRFGAKKWSRSVPVMLRFVHYRGSPKRHYGVSR